MENEIYTNLQEIESKTATLKKIGSSDEEWTIFYEDENAQKWELNFYESDFKRHGVQILKKAKEYSIQDLIQIAITSTNKDEIIGASIELFFKEHDNKGEFRSELIHALEKFDLNHISEFDKERLKIIIYESNLYDPLNRRKIVGISKEEFDTNVNYFRENASRAKEILENIK